MIQRFRAFVSMAVVVCTAMLLLPAPAHAYIDPLSGSIIFQVLAAGILGATITLKKFGRRILALFVTPKEDGEREAR